MSRRPRALLVGVLRLGWRHWGRLRRRREPVEGLGQDGGHAVVLVDDQSLEEGLVELAPDPVVGFAVGGLAVAGSRQRPGEGGLTAVEVGGYLVEPSIDGHQRGCDAVLLGLEKVQRNGLCEVDVEQGGSFAFGASFASFLQGALFVGALPEACDLIQQEVGDCLQLLFGEPDGRVVLGDGLLDELDALCPLGTALTILLPADTDEVGLNASPAPGVIDDQSSAAAAAEQ